MKTILLLFLAACATSAVAQDTIYYNRLWKETTPANAAYFRIRTKSTTGWQVTDHWLSGKTQMSGAYSDDSCHVKAGEFVYFDTTGIANHRVTYANGKQNGPESYFYPDGHPRMTGNNKDDDADGEWIGYYPSGKLSGKARYKKGKQVSGAFYHEDGSPDKSIKEFMRESEFPGGVAQWLRFLNKTLRYPDSAVTYEIQGTVIVDFMVSKEGKAHNFHISQSVDKNLDAEALRVMNLMPDWIPAIYGGIPSDSYKRQPIVFRLQAE